MSIYNPQFPNSLHIRAKKVQADDYLILDRLTGQYVPLKSGGDGPTPTGLPYYLKANAVALDDGPGGHVASLESSGVTFVAGQEHEKWGALDIQENRFKVNRIDNDVADVDLKANILNDRVDNITNVQLPAHEASINQVDAKVTNITSVVLPAHEASINQIDDKVTNINNVTIPAINAKVTTNTNDITVLKAKQLKDPIVFTTSNRELKMGAVSGINYRDKTAPIPNSVNITSETVECGSSVWKTVMNPSNFTLIAGANTHVITTDSIMTLTALKNMTPITGATSSKMVVFNPSTKVFNHTDIPSGGGDLQRGYYRLETLADPSQTYVTKLNFDSGNGVWRVSNSAISQLGKFKFFSELTLDFANVPFQAGNTETTVDYGFIVEGLSTNDAVTCTYFPYSGGKSPTSITSYCNTLWFNSQHAPQTILRFRVNYSDDFYTNFTGKIVFNITKMSGQNSAKPLDWVGRVG